MTPREALATIKGRAPRNTRAEALEKARRLAAGPMDSLTVNEIVRLRKDHHLTWDEIVCIPGPGETINSEGEIER